MARDFKYYSVEAQKFVDLLAVDLGCSEDNDKAKRILKAVLHTIRDRVTIPESFQLLAQLPMLLKGLFVENWKYTDRPLKYKNPHTLLAALIKAEHLAESNDFPNENYAVFAVKAVFKNLSKYVSAGEMGDVMAQLPPDIRSIVEIKQ